MNTLKHILPRLFSICLFLGFAGTAYAQGSLQENAIYSPSLEGNLLGDTSTRNLIVYMPPGYESSQARYPVVYLLHTGGASEGFFPYNEFPVSYEATGMFTLPQDFPEKGFVAMIDSLIASGDIEPMIIVMPNILTAYGGSFCINSVLNGNYENYIVDELVPYVDHTFRTLTDRKSRAIGGHCMGGFGAMYLAMKHPGVFGLVASHSSELCIDALARASQPIIKMENPEGIIGPDPAKPFTSFFYFFSAAYSPNLDNPPFYMDLPFDDTCGLREDVLQQWAVYDPIQMIPGHLAALQSLKGIYLDVGDKDELQSFYFMTPFSGALKAAGIPHSFEIFSGKHYSHLYTRLSNSMRFFSDSMDHVAKGPTIIPGGNVSGTWTLAGSPYMINGEINLPDGLSLNIEPGVVVNFNGHYKFRVQGTLLARGTAKDSIKFTAEDYETGWHGLKLIDTPATNDSSIFEYCIFEYGKANTGNAPDDRAGGALLLQCDKARVSHCLFRHNMCYTPTRNGGGAGGAIAIIGSPLIENSEFRENSGTYGSSLFVYQKGSNPVIRNNLFHFNRGHGTINVLLQASPVLLNNIITNNITDSHGHLHFALGGTDAVVINNTIVNNTSEGSGAGIFVNDGLAPLIINSIIHGNEPAQVLLEMPSAIEFHHCLIENGKEGFIGKSFTGVYENNMDTLPFFMDVSQGDYHLDDQSPCISAGLDSVKCKGNWYYIPGKDFEGNVKPYPEGTAPDIGAFESVLGYTQNPLNNEYDSGNLTGSGLIMYHPNPFDQSTTITFTTRKEGWVSLEVYNMRGGQIESLMNMRQTAGKHKFRWQPENLKPGLYLLRLRTPDYTHLGKLICIN